MQTKGGKLLAQAVLSGAQMVPGLAVSALATPAAGAAVMGLQAAGAKTGELRSRGVSAGEALARGLVSGGIEGATEKIPIGNLLKIVKGSGGATFLKNIAKQAGIEATEESACYALNFLADKAAQDPEAKFSLAELAENAAVGAISGGAFGGLGSLAATVNHPTQGSGPLSRQSNPLLRALDRRQQEQTAQAEGSKPTAPATRQAERPSAQPKTTTQEDTLAKSQAAGEVSADFGQAESHIDRRTRETVGDRSVKAFQFDHPQLHPYYVQAAQALLEDVESSFQTQRAQRGKGTIVRRSEALVQAEDLGLSRQELTKVLEDIIADNGQENYAAAKRVELILDNMLSKGYLPNRETTTLDRWVGPNEAYLQAKQAIPGGVEQGSFEAYRRDNRLALETGEVTEGQLRAEWEAGQETPLPQGQGAMSKGGAGAFSSWQAETPAGVFHPVNETAASVTAANRGRGAEEVPLVNPQGRLTSKTAATLLNANITPNDFAVILEEELAKGNFSRMAYSDNAAGALAEQTIQEKGYQRAKEDWLAELRSGSLSKNVTALGVSLYNEAVNAGATVDALDIATEMVAYGKSLGQSLQAFYLINKMTPSGQLYSLAKTAEHLEERAKTRAKKDPETGLPQVEGVQIDPDLAQQFLEAETQTDRDAIKEKIYKDLARQLPANWKDKLEAWRYLAMLGNPRTQVRNIVGNLGFVPVRKAKNVIGAGLETLTGVEERTKAVTNRAFNAEDRARYLAGVADFANVEELVLNSGKFRDDYSKIDDYRTIFRFQPVEAWRKATNWGLEQGDVIFSKGAYADSLAGYLKANKLTAEEFLVSEEIQQKAREYAILEAQKATYRDVNAFSEMVSKLGKLKNSPSRAERAMGYVVEGVLPFKKTPANILVRGVEYSPLGLVKGLADMQTRVRRNEISAAQGIDEIAAGLTGTGLMALGVLLAKLGLVTGGASGDDKQDDFDELTGGQNYALSIGDYNVTLDWLAPEALSFFVGVESYRTFDQLVAGDTEKKQDIFQALGRIADPMLEMSMLQSLNDVIDSVGSESPFLSAVASAASSYVTQFVPTLFGQIERTLEDTRQATFIDRDSWVPTSVQYMLGKTMNKLPGEYHQQDYLDAWGRTEPTGNPLVRALNNFLNPAYVSKNNATAVDQELQRLKDAGFDGMFPTAVQKNSKVGERYVTGQAWSAVQGTKGQTAYQTLQEILPSDTYRSLSDREKADLVARVYNYAGELAKQSADQDFALSSWVEDVEAAKAAGLTAGEYFNAVNQRAQINKDEEANASKRAYQFETWVDKQNLTEEKKAFLKDNLKIWQMTPATSSSYQKIVDAGFSLEEAEEVLALKKSGDTDGNGSYSQLELYSTIQNAGYDEAKKEQLWNAMKASSVTETWDEAKTELAPRAAQTEKAQKALGDMDQEKRASFGQAVSTCGKNSYREIVSALTSVEATETERALYYNYINAQRANPWKKDWAGAKAEAAKKKK